MDENPTITEPNIKNHEDEAIDLNSSPPNDSQSPDGKLPHVPDPATDTDNQLLTAGAVRTLDGEIAGDEFAGDAVNYQILLGKIEALLGRLGVDA